MKTCFSFLWPDVRKNETLLPYYANFAKHLMQYSVKMVKSWKPLTIFAKFSILDIDRLLITPLLYLQYHSLSWYWFIPKMGYCAKNNLRMKWDKGYISAYHLHQLDAIYILTKGVYHCSVIPAWERPSVLNGGFKYPLTKKKIYTAENSLSQIV